MLMLIPAPCDSLVFLFSLLPQANLHSNSNQNSCQMPSLKLMSTHLVKILTSISGWKLESTS